MRNLIPRAGLLALLGATALGQESWYEDFEGYPPDLPLEGQGGWAGWNGADDDGLTVVTTNMARTGFQSAQVKAGADSVREIDGAVGGQWVLTAWVYTPTQGLQSGAFVVLSRYASPGVKRWSGQFIFDLDTDTLQCWCGGPNATHHPLVVDQWVEIRFEIDLEADWVDAYYDGQHLAGYVWSEGISGTYDDGKRAIAAVDVVLDPAFQGAPIFFDDISLEYKGGGRIGQPYCGPGVPNSTGLSGKVGAFGSDLASEQPLRIIAKNLPPGMPAILLVSRTQDFVPNAFGGQGTLCLGQPYGRFKAKVTVGDAAGIASVDVNTAKLPLLGGQDVQPGETWNFQFVHRDLIPGATTNLTDAVAVTFK